ncbi:hypothetical protein [Winogradskyella luteola]|uniref:Uncharacterized protein n=1 Tax=Winogradskyella luteola TaxID=2828330 RepID=A0A9X1FCV1_9FLAO|nr:hypothetical protein [Winogradskyella luteola]MBV7270663.1 hypothetical protein [Winogradskyella luteola]
MVYKGGVLIVGSLLWERSEIRSKWRRESLRITNRVNIKAPIRYGRISESRYDTYTMVLSSKCNSKNDIGRAVFVPFLNDRLSIERIIEESKFMIDAERNKVKDFNRLNWGWGCVGIVINPKHFKNDELKNLLNTWSENYSRGFDPQQYKIGDEVPIINSGGVLNITWDNKIDDYDFFIATVTKPNVKAYPTEEVIANLMIENNYFDYFENNINNAISTFQDKNIELILKNNKNVK